MRRILIMYNLGTIHHGGGGRWGMDSIVEELEGKIRTKLAKRYDDYISYQYFSEMVYKDFDEWAESNRNQIKENLEIEDEIRRLCLALTGTIEDNVHQVFKLLLNNGTLTPEEYKEFVQRYLE